MLEHKARTKFDTTTDARRPNHTVCFGLEPALANVRKISGFVSLRFELSDRRAAGRGSKTGRPTINRSPDRQTCSERRTLHVVRRIDDHVVLVKELAKHTLVVSGAKSRCRRQIAGRIRLIVTVVIEMRVATATSRITAGVAMKAKEVGIMQRRTKVCKQTQVDDKKPNFGFGVLHLESRPEKSQVLTT